MAFQKYQNTSVKGFDIHLQRRSRFSSISSVLKSKLLNYLLQILPPRVGLMKSNQIKSLKWLWFFRNCRKNKFLYDNARKTVFLWILVICIVVTSAYSKDLTTLSSLPPCVPSHSLRSSTWTPSHLEEPHYLWQLCHLPADWWLPLHTVHFPKACQIWRTPLLRQSLLRQKSDWSPYFWTDQGKTERRHFIPPLLRKQSKFSNKKLFFKEKHKYRLMADDVHLPLTLQMEGANPSSLIPLLLWAPRWNSSVLHVLLGVRIGMSHLTQF